MKQPLTVRQLCAYCLLAVSAPTVTVCAGMPWKQVAAVSAAVTLLLAVLLLLWRKAGGDGLAVVMERAWGKGIAAVLLVGEGIFAVLLLCRFAAGTDTAFPDAPTLPFVPLVLLAVTAWAVWQGRRACVRSVCVLFFFAAALLLAIFFFALPDAKAPGASNGGSLLPAAVLLLPVYGLFLAEPGPRGEKAGWWLLPFCLLPPATALLVAAVPGSRGSFYSMAKSVEVLAVAQRLEPLVSACLTAGWFAAMTLVALSVGEIAGALGGKIRPIAAGSCLLALPGAWGRVPVSDSILLWGAVLFCGAIPLATLFVAGAKNFYKKSKKGVDKGVRE